jgi:Cu/Ag efflux protein CusF
MYQKENVMLRPLIGGVLGFVLLVTALPAQEGIQRGKIKKVDADKGTIIITADGKDLELLVAETTRIVTPEGESSKGIKDAALKEGALVMFKAVEKDGKHVLAGLRVGGEGGPREPGADIRKAKVKKLDLDRMVLTLIVGEKDLEFPLTEQTQVLGAQGKDLKERLQGFKEGSAVMFKTEKREGKEVLVGLKLDDGKPAPPREQPKVDTSKLKPLTEMGSEEYQGHKGGLYPDGKNERPAAHEAAGLALAKQVQPLDSDGKPSADGKIVLLSVGMSNTTQEFSVFKRSADRDEDKNPKLVVVDGAQGGMSANRILKTDDNGTGTRFWTTVDQRLKNGGVTREQVQVAWIKQADPGPSQGFPKYAQTLQDELRQIVQLMHERFPNLKIVYLSSRTYAGYASTPLNPEPYAYESGFSVRWLIEEQLKGEAALNYDPKKGAVKAPWLSWGPYLWANGTTKRADGFFYEERDFGGDGTHPSASGQRKVADLLLKFFKSDATAKVWFVRQ